MSDGLMAAILLIGAITSGISGFGFALVSLTLLSFIVNIKLAVAFLVIHSLGQNLMQCFHLRGHFDFKALTPLLAGAALGVPPGVLFLKSMDAALVQKVLGLVIILFVIQSVFKSGVSRGKELGAGLTGMIGVTGGMLMGAFISGGPPIVMYAVKAGGNKYQIKATMQAFFLFSNLFALILYWYSGLITMDLALSSIRFLPVSLLGTLIGIKMFSGMSNTAFNKWVYIFLFCIGITILIK